MAVFVIKPCTTFRSEPVGPVSSLVDSWRGGGGGRTGCLGIVARGGQGVGGRGGGGRVAGGSTLVFKMCATDRQPIFFSYKSKKLT